MRKYLIGTVISLTIKESKESSSPDIRYQCINPFGSFVNTMPEAITIYLQTWKLPSEARIEAPTQAENILSEVFPPVTTFTFILDVVFAAHSVVNLSLNP